MKNIEKNYLTLLALLVLPASAMANTPACKIQMAPDQPASTRAIVSQAIEDAGCVETTDDADFQVLAFHSYMMNEPGNRFQDWTGRNIHEAATTIDLLNLRTGKKIEKTRWTTTLGETLIEKSDKKVLKTLTRLIREEIR